MQIFPVSAGSTDRFLSARLLLHSCPFSPSHPRLPTQSLLASYCTPSSLLHMRSSTQPSQPPTHSLGMNRSEKLSCVIKCAKVLLNMTALDVEELFFFFFFSLEGSRMLSRLLVCVWPVHPKLRVTNVLPSTCASSQAVWLSVHHHCQTLSSRQRNTASQLCVCCNWI